MSPIFTGSIVPFLQHAFELFLWIVVGLLALWAGFEFVAFAILRRRS
jgi:hypothetical protein